MSEPYEPCFSDQNKLYFVSVFTGSTDNGKLKVPHDSLHQIFTTTELEQTVVIFNSWKKRAERTRGFLSELNKLFIRESIIPYFPQYFFQDTGKENHGRINAVNTAQHTTLEQICGPFKSVVTIIVCSCHSKSSYLFVLLSYNCNCLWRKCGIGGEGTLDGCVCVSVCKDDKPHTFSLICRRQTYMYHKGTLKPFGSIYNTAEHAMSLAYTERICSL